MTFLAVAKPIQEQVLELFLSASEWLSIWRKINPIRWGHVVKIIKVDIDMVQAVFSVD